MRTASIILIGILLSTGAALAQVSEPAIKSLADAQTAVVIPIRGEINDYTRDAFMRRLAKDPAVMGDHALGLAGKLTTGITLALVAASVTALAVLSVA